MQTFTKTQIAMAVGTALMVMAGAAQAAVPAGPPIARVLRPVLATPASVANATLLYGTTGFTGTVPVRMNFTAPVDSLGGANFAIVTAGFDGLRVNLANNAATTVGASVATDDITVYAGTLGATQINLRVPTASVVFTPNIISTSVADAAFSIVTGGTEAVRVNATTGAFEYTTDNTAATITWLPLSVAVQVPLQTGTVRNAITANDSTDVGALDHEAATSTVISAIAGQSSFNTVAPTATARTRSTAGASLVDGVVIDTVTPLAATIVVGLATAGISFTSNAAGCSPAVADVNNAADIAAAAPVAPATGLSTAIAGSLNTITFVGATTDWTTGAAAVDAAAYVSDCFNTGIATGSLPFNIAVTGTPTNLPTYSLVFAAAGTNQVLAALPGAITDGAAPVVVSTVSNTAGAPAGTTQLEIRFSEPMAFINVTPANNVAEIAENIKLGADSLAALNLNAGAGLAVALAGPTLGQSTLNITGVLAADAAGKTLSIATGVSDLENNDVGFSLTKAARDVAADGGLQTATFEQVSSAGALAAALLVAAPTLTIDVDSDTTASASTGTDPTKVATVAVRFRAGKEVAFATGRTAADLANNLVVVINGLAANGAPAIFQFHPAAADVALTTANTITITLPTQLIHSRIHLVNRIVVHYKSLVNAAGAGATASDIALAVGGNVLVGNASATVIVDSGNVTASLPLAVISNTLYTQSIRGKMTGQSAASSVRAYLARFVDSNPSAGGAAQITGGKISRAGDPLINNLAITFASGADQGGNAGVGDIEAAIAASRNAAAAAVTAVPGVRDAALPRLPRPITVYAALVRTNDTRANGNGNNTGGTGGNDFIQGTVALGLTLGDVQGWNSNNDAIYELTLDPVTGNITGTLTGKLDITFTPGNTGAYGLIVDGGGAAPNAEATVAADGSFDLLVGVEPTSLQVGQGMAGFQDRFVILVHDDSGNTRRFTQLTSANPANVNFVTFEPNLASLKGTRTVLGVAPGIAGPFAATTGSAQTIDLSKYLSGNVVGAGAALPWRIRSAVNPANVAVVPPTASFARSQVGLDRTTNDGAPRSVWTNDGAMTDMAMTMTGSKVFIATELANGSTLSTITNGSFTPGAVAFAFRSDGLPNATVQFNPAQGVPLTSIKVGLGWSLVAAPNATPSAAVDAIIRVGSATGQFTWIRGDAGAVPALTVGEGVFVFSKLGGAL